MLYVVCHQSNGTDFFECSVATLDINTAVQLEVWNIDNTARLNATQSIYCVPRTCEVNSSVLVDCSMKNRHTGILSHFMPSNFASDPTKMQQKYMTS
jgi:hypothetical protein